MAMGHARAQTFAARAAAVTSRHVGGGPSFVDEDEAVQVEIELALEPVLAALQDIRVLLLARMRGLFLGVMR
jgi:hypothetical protein